MFSLSSVISISIGTGLRTILSYLFKLSFFRLIAFAVIFILVGLVSYFVADWFLPEWFSLSHLNELVADFNPSVAYFLDYFAVYQGAKYVFQAYAANMILSLVPAWTWWGSLFKVAQS